MCAGSLVGLTDRAYPNPNPYVLKLLPFLKVIVLRFYFEGGLSCVPVCALCAIINPVRYEADR